MTELSTTPIVLVADDSSIVRRQVINALSHLQLDVRQAADGLEALAFINANPVAMLLTDINMPRMSGVELLTTLAERGYQFPCLVLTSETQVERLRQAREAGALGWITKPFDPKHLATATARALARFSLPAGVLP